MTVTLRKRLMLAMAALVVFGVGGVASQAGFTDSASVVASGGTGTVVVNLDAKDGGGAQKSISLTAVNTHTFKPGDSVTDDFDIMYTGSLASTVTFTKSFSGDTSAGALPGELQATVKIDGVQVASSSLASLQIPSQSFSGPGTKNVQVTVTLPAGASTTLQSQSVTTAITVNAAQS